MLENSPSNKVNQAVLLSVCVPMSDTLINIQKPFSVPSPTGLLLDKSENSYVLSMSVALLINHVATQEKQETDTPCTYSSENTMGTLPGHNLLDLSQKEWLW